MEDLASSTVFDDNVTELDEYLGMSSNKKRRSKSKYLFSKQRETHISANKYV